MAATLKAFMGQAGAGLDDSVGTDNLYDVLRDLANVQNDLVAQLNQLIIDHDASTTPTTATAVTPLVTVE